jgi:hypothetical protein
VTAIIPYELRIMKLETFRHVCCIYNLFLKYYPIYVYIYASILIPLPYPTTLF